MAQPAKSSMADFQRLQGFHVEVVGGFVEEEDVAARAQQFGHVDAVAFPAGQEADLLLLVGALEVERTGIDAAVHLRDRPAG